MRLRRIKLTLSGMAVAVAFAAYCQIATAQTDVTESSIGPSAPVERPETPPVIQPKTESAAPAAAVSEHPAAMIPYTVRPGDTFGGVAKMFGVPSETLAHANKINPDDELVAGDVLKVPNPFAAQVETLQSQLNGTAAQLRNSNQKAESAQDDIRSLQSQVQELTADNHELQANQQALTWWRATAASIGVAAVLMFGVMLVSMFEWWRMRRRFVALAGLADALGHLDYKYKASLAKAELRLQQLYGRRRQGGVAEGQPRPKMPEEVEIELLNEELKNVLELHLQRLGAKPRGSRRRKGWRDMLSTSDPVSETAEARPVRR